MACWPVAVLIGPAYASRVKASLAALHGLNRFGLLPLLTLEVLLLVPVKYDGFGKEAGEMTSGLTRAWRHGEAARHCPGFHGNQWDG